MPTDDVDYEVLREVALGVARQITRRHPLPDGDIEDVAQDMLVEFIKIIRRGEAVLFPRALLLSLAKLVCGKLLRRKRVAESVSDCWFMYEWEHWSYSRQVDTRDEMLSLLEHAKNDYQRELIMAAYNGCNFGLSQERQGAAELMGISLGRLNNELHRLRQAIKGDKRD